MSEVPTALVIGAGPAGLMATDLLSQAGLKVVVADQKPSVARKFLMAGKSGLNLTREEPLERFLSRYSSDQLVPMVTAFGPDRVVEWAEELGEPVFSGSTGRVFPKRMKASPLLRSWLKRLGDQGVEIKTRWTWVGINDASFDFETPEGVVAISPLVTILATGGASWPRLGSDASFASILEGAGIPVAPFGPSNVALKLTWSDYMRAQFGRPLKNIALHAGKTISRGEAIITRVGLEGGGIYELSPQLRADAPLHIDLLPTMKPERLYGMLARRSRKQTLGRFLSSTLKFTPAKRAIFQEFARPLPIDPGELAALIKELPINYDGVAGLERAISSIGGVAWDAVDDRLMLKSLPGVFVAGEMLNWDAPTGGYLMTACLATGRWAGQAAAKYAQRMS